MLKVLSGWFDCEESIPYWLQPKLSMMFTKFVKEDWLTDDIVKQELRDVDDIVKIDGLNLYKSNGKRIPVDWISQGSKQFIYTVNMLPREVVDCYHVGWNVFKYFYFWCEKYKQDITILTNTNEMLLIEDCELKGVVLNRNRVFNSNRELADTIYDCRDDELISVEDSWVLTAKAENNKCYNIYL